MCQFVPLTANKQFHKLNSMKQKINNTSPVTKAELTEVLQEYPTKKDLKDILSNYPTKDELAERLNASFAAFRQENIHNFQMMMERFDETFSKFTNLILATIDPLVKDLEIRREDREIAVAEMKDVKKRLTKLEQS